MQPPTPLDTATNRFNILKLAAENLGFTDVTDLIRQTKQLADYVFGGQ